MPSMQHANHSEERTMLDEHFDADLECLEFADDEGDWDEEDLGLVWDGAEVERLASQLGAHRPHAF